MSGRKIEMPLLLTSSQLVRTDFDFELLMGNDVAPRKDFIIAGQGLDRSRVDA